MIVLTHIAAFLVGVGSVFWAVHVLAPRLPVMLRLRLARRFRQLANAISPDNF